MGCVNVGRCPSRSGWCTGQDRVPGPECVGLILGAYENLLKTSSQEKQETQAEAVPEILYRCDRRACSVCQVGCQYTRDVRHAEHFQLEGGDFVEQIIGSQDIQCCLQIDGHEIAEILGGGDSDGRDSGKS